MKKKVVLRQPRVHEAAQMSNGHTRSVWSGWTPSGGG